MKDGKKDDNLKEIIKKGSGYRKLVATLVAVTGMSAVAVIGAKELYDSFFRRYERPNYATKAGLYDYELLKDELPREEISFYSGKVRLKGYYYKAESGKGLVVVVHGLHAGADDYLPITEYFVKSGYSVFAYDGTGTYDSEGDSTVGMCQSLVDLDSALKFIETDAELSAYPLFLLGHSCGGYAVTSVLSLHKNVSACAGIAAVNNCYTLIVEKGMQYGGKLAAEGIPKIFLEAYQSILFGDYTNYSGAKGISESDIPVLIAHGNNDKIISFGGQSVISHRDEITNPNVEYYIGVGDCGGHDSIWHSERSAKYREKVDKAAKEIDDSAKKAEFYKTVDNRLYSEINYELFDKIKAMFDRTLEN